MTTNSELHWPDTVCIKKGEYGGAIGYIAAIGKKKNGVPLYLVYIPGVDLFLYKRDEIERVTQESRGEV